MYLVFTHVYAEVRAEHWVSSSMAVCLIALNQGHSLN